jgi:hypothetical protein
MPAQPPHQPRATLAGHLRDSGTAAEVRTAAERTDARPEARAVPPARSDAATGHKSPRCSTRPAFLAGRGLAAAFLTSKINLVRRVPLGNITDFPSIVED